MQFGNKLVASSCQPTGNIGNPLAHTIVRIILLLVHTIVRITLVLVHTIVRIILLLVHTIVRIILLLNLQ